MKKRFLLIIPGVIIMLCSAFLLYTGVYYHADASALAALKSDEYVHVTQTEYGWLFDGPSETDALIYYPGGKLFDGPSETDALIYYPGGKVEETAYAPLLHGIAAQDMDVCLVRMPFRLAVFGADKAAQVMRKYDYDSWYIGGHSLGGVMAADYAAGNHTGLTGVVLQGLHVISIYGSEDGVLNRTRMREYGRCLPADSEQYVISGGNHAQFGNYGKQTGDGEAAISAEEQQRRTEELIRKSIFPKKNPEPCPPAKYEHTSVSEQIP